MTILSLCLESFARKIRFSISRSLSVLFIGLIKGYLSEFLKSTHLPLSHFPRLVSIHFCIEVSQEVTAYDVASGVVSIDRYISVYIFCNLDHEVTRKCHRMFSFCSCLYFPVFLLNVILRRYSPLMRSVEEALLTFAFLFVWTCTAFDSCMQRENRLPFHLISSGYQTLMLPSLQRQVSFTVCLNIDDDEERLLMAKVVSWILLLHFLRQ